MTRGLLGLLIVIVLGVVLVPLAAWPADEPPAKESSTSLRERLRERVYG